MAPTMPPRALALLLWSATPDRPDLTVTPLVHAVSACALDCRVELHFAGPAVRWLVTGVAEAAYPTAGREKSIGEWLHEIAAAGGVLRACSMACAAWVAPDERLVECWGGGRAFGMAGATAFVARTLDPGWRTLVF